MREFNSLFPVEIRNRNECDLTNAKRHETITHFRGHFTRRDTRSFSGLLERRGDYDERRREATWQLELLWNLPRAFLCAPPAGHNSHTRGKRERRKGESESERVGREEAIQGSAKRRGIGCVNSLPGSAWL